MAIFFFLFLELGIFSLKFGGGGGGEHTFCHWEHDPISVIKIGPKNPRIKYDCLNVEPSHLYLL